MRRGGLQELLQAIGGAGHEVTDPRLPDLQVLTGAAHGSTDPRLAPPPSNPPQATGAAGTTDPAVALQHAYAMWLKLTGRSQDPLAARVGRQPPPDQPGAAHTAVDLLRFGGNPFRQITHGANAGLFAQTYSLGDGRTANVYYDPNGRRRVRAY